MPVPEALVASETASRSDLFESLRNMNQSKTPKHRKRTVDVATVTPEKRRRQRWKFQIFGNGKRKQIPFDLLAPTVYNADEESADVRRSGDHGGEQLKVQVPSNFPLSPSNSTTYPQVSDIELPAIQSELDYTRHIRSIPRESNLLQEDFYHCTVEDSELDVAGAGSLQGCSSVAVDDDEKSLSQSQATDPLPRPNPSSHSELHESMVEIFPGCVVPLHGCQETWDAFVHGSAVVVDCGSCRAALYCVSNATMVLCPDCRDISMVTTDSEVATKEPSVGLGLAMAHAHADLL